MDGSTIRNKRFHLHILFQIVAFSYHESWQCFFPTFHLLGPRFESRTGVLYTVDWVFSLYLIVRAFSFYRGLNFPPHPIKL